LPTDFQQPARRAFAYAVKLALALGARLEILHVIKTVSDRSRRPPDSRYLKSLKTAALLELGRMAQMAGEAGVRTEPCLRFGVPDACVLQVAKHAGAEMIVMGTEGRTGWDRLHLGSTAQAVVRAAPCPVLTIHGGLAGDAVRHHAQVRLRRLLVATDFSPCASAALRAATGLAVRLRASVLVVHAVERKTACGSGQRRLDALVKELRRDGVESEGLCVPGDPVEMILGQAATWQADLIVVGTQGRRGLSRLALGSVAEAVLKRAGCPVLIVRHAPRAR
jgi:nucleotide-binding universal stress UspA family protein